MDVEAVRHLSTAIAMTRFPCVPLGMWTAAVALSRLYDCTRCTCVTQPGDPMTLNREEKGAVKDCRLAVVQRVSNHRLLRLFP